MKVAESRLVHHNFVCSSLQHRAYTDVLHHSKKLRRRPSIRYVRLICLVRSSTATILTSFTQFKEDPDAWLLVDKVLQEAEYPQTKCL